MPSSQVLFPDKDYFKADHGSYLPAGLIFVCWIISAACLAAFLFNPSVVFLLLSFLGPFAAFTRIGIEVDFKSIKYREYTSIFGLKSGKWKDIPENRYISVFRTKHVEQVNSRVSYGTFEDLVFEINLIVNKRDKINLTEYEGRDQALSLGKAFGSLLNCRVLDCTEREQKWLP